MHRCLWMPSPNLFSFFFDMKSHNIEELYQTMHEGLKNYDTSEKIFFVCCKKNEIGHVIKDRKYVYFFTSSFIRKNLIDLAMQKMNEVQFADPENEYERLSMGNFWTGFYKDHHEELRELTRTIIRNRGSYY